MKSGYRFLGFILGALFVLSGDAMAAFDLAVTADRGGREIRFETAEFGRAVRNEEFTVTVSTDVSQRYRIILRQFDALRNEWGAELSSGAVKYFSPSSVGGDLDIVFPTELRLGESEIYTSDAAGSAVTFALVFGLEISEKDGPGTYRSSLIFELQDLAGGNPLDTVVKNIEVEVDADYNITVRSEHGGRGIDLGKINRKRPEGEVDVVLTVPSAIGGPYKIYQHLVNTPTSGAGERASNIFVRTDTPATGSVSADKIQLDQSRVLLYSSDESGTGVELGMQYFTEGASTMLAGRYDGVLQYEVETQSASAFFEPVTANISMLVETIFDLEVLHDSVSPLYFGRFRTEGEQQYREIEVRIISNTGEQYQVIQNIARPFTNESGDELPMKQLTIAMEGAEYGSMKFTSDGQLEVGNNSIYVSDGDGSSDSFKIEYSLTLPRNARKGEYTSETTYSLNAL